ncbi:transcription factor AP-1-like [Limulus polyphemus]|uniref:Transcription factor AP-1-like n=1 Tax=Limulus polyphemus TaxID=6850 RepID=A0ABM1BIK8_LIMPO|nr:transcription factor AP-1-like [Limulus polyphemus]
METTFYDNSFARSRDEYGTLKRPATLDLNQSKYSKKQKMNILLTSPDLNMLKLESPELERLIITHNGLVTTTPTPTQYPFSRSVTEEQEQYARGFVDALNQLHQATAPSAGSVVPQPVAATEENLVVSSSSTCTILPVTNGYVKDEPQTVPNLGQSPPMSPINMENQERIKLERKRLRNRIAASKCRRRKLERISRLEEKVAQLKTENNDLGSVVNKLRDQVCTLKQHVMEHAKNGCQIMVSNHAF